MAAIIIRELDPAALDQLAALERYSFHPLARMRARRLAHFPLSSAAAALAVWDFVTTWGTFGQLCKLQKVILAGGMVPPKITRQPEPREPRWRYRDRWRVTS